MEELNIKVIWDFLKISQEKFLILLKKKRERRKDYEIQSETKYFKTGIIFKDKHYYETQKVIPKDYYVRFERTVNEYSYVTKNYGEWREIS